jgi:signal transduction histidine kinase
MEAETAVQYNGCVNARISPADPVRVIRFAAILWLAYLAALAVISESFGDPRRDSVETTYYLLLGGVALVCLGLSFWSWIQARLGKAFMPLMIAFITATPILVALAIIRMHPGNPSLDSEGLLLRLLPFLLIGFLLVAWQYRWQYVLLIVLAVAGLNAGVIWRFPPPGSGPPMPPLRFILVVPLIQTAVFLAVGFSISFLMGRLRHQQESLQAANLRLSHYSSTLEELATTKERSRLARELHDTLAHTLSGLSVQLETIKAYWDVDHELAMSALEGSLTTAHAGLEETRRALKALRATPLEDLGLVAALQAMLQSEASRAGLKLHLSMPDAIPALAPDVEQAIYRIVQETLTNVISHAHARNLTVLVELADDKLSLHLTDDGAGFEVDQAVKQSKFGLTGMKERTDLVGGRLEIDSKPGQGTEVKLVVPIGA